MSQPILTAVDGGVATLTLNRRQALNTLDQEMASALQASTAEFSADDAVRCILIRGAGGNFMAGGDIGYFHRCLALSDEQRAGAVAAVIEVVHGAIRNIRNAPKPVVACVEGACAGFGVSLLAACDLAVAADNAIFSLAYSRIGITPDGGSTWFLPRLVGLKRAAALCLLADRFGAAEALEMGLVNQVVDAGALDEASGALAVRLARGPSKAFAGAKALLNRSLSATLEAQLDAEEACFIEGVKGTEFAEGVRAFVEKRNPDFQG
jgi:2-(1,2-epoxy-1,2-dihydrophenyl)acetyl-CoA isomerase